MTKIIIDSDKLESASKQIKEYVTKIDQILTSYNERMQKVPNETKEWQGNSAENFVTIIKKEYTNDYLPLMGNIRQYANLLQDIANDYKSVVKETPL